MSQPARRSSMRPNRQPRTRTTPAIPTGPIAGRARPFQQTIGVSNMNDTLSRIKAEAARVQAARAQGRDAALAMAQRRQAAAAALFAAFADVQDQFVRVEVLQQIWPADYQQRNDRARGLVVALLGPEQHPCGLRLRVPGGFRSFEVQETWDGQLRYISAREGPAGRTQATHFDHPQPWLEVFYRTMAMLLEL